MAGTSRCRCAPRRRACASAKSRSPTIAAPAAPRRSRAACAARCAPERASWQPSAGLQPTPPLHEDTMLRSVLLALILLAAPAHAQAPAGPVHVADLIGLPILDGDKVEMGRVRGVTRTGA